MGEYLNENIPVIKHNESMVYTLMEHISNYWKDTSIPLDTLDFKSITFLLLHGVYQARRYYNFSHDDIHTGQILLRPSHESNTQIDIEIQDKYYKLRCGRFIPKLIDFDMTRIFDLDPLYPEDDTDDLIDSDEIIIDDLTHDIRNLFVALSVRVPTKLKKEFYDFWDFFTPEDRSTLTLRTDFNLIVNMLKHPFFKDILTQTSTEDTILVNHRCITCAQRASYKVKRSDTTWKFCGQKCLDVFDPHMF